MQDNTAHSYLCQTEFKDNSKKVKYIADHFITLQNILDHDESLSTMLIDIINRAIYGKDTPTIYTESTYTPFKPLKENISLPPPPTIIERSSDDDEINDEKNCNPTDFQRLPVDNFLKMNKTIEYSNKLEDNDNPRAIIFCNIA